MSLLKKAVSAGTSAALLASLFATAIAPAVSASTAVTSVGTVPRGGESAKTLVFSFSELTKACLANAAGEFTVTIAPATATGSVTFTGTPVVAAPGSLGASASVAGSVLTVDTTGSDPLNIESITISGLGIAASTNAALGAIKATMADVTGSFVACFQPGGTASGTLASGIAIGATSVIVNVATLPGCDFAITDTVDLIPGTLDFGQNAESVNVTAVVAGPGVGQDTLTISATTAIHDAATAVSQLDACTANGILASPGTVADSLIYNAPAAISNLFPGESNQLLLANSNLTATERSAGFLSAGTTVTFTISTAGVTFSRIPTLTATNGLTFGLVTLSADRTAASATVTAASTAPSTITLGGATTATRLMYDVASTVASGTLVNVTLGLSGSKVVVPTSRANAQVGRILNATAAPVPNVFIGQNAQKTGLVTITEVGAGSFTDGTGPNNVFEICPDSDSSFTSPGPWAKVTAGDLKLREGATVSPDNIVQGTQDTTVGRTGCYYWTVWTASTTASTIVIGNSDFTSGPLVNVDADVAPGALNATISAGSLGSLVDQVVVTIANRVFQNQVVVTALSQPTIPAGSTDALAGNIQIQETGNGQLKANEDICVEVLPRTSNNAIQDTFLKALNTADLPVATASGGVIISPVTASPFTCAELQLGAVTPTNTHTVSFSFTVQQQSTTGQGKVVISNIHYITVADAPAGNVLVNVFGFGGSPTFVEFQSTISNAKIGTAGVADAWIAKGLNVRAASAFTLATASVKRGTYVTIRAKSSNAPAGTLGQIWVKTKTTAWHLESSRRVGTGGYLYYSGKVLNLGYRYYKVSFVAGGTSNTVRGFGK